MKTFVVLIFSMLIAIVGYSQSWHQLGNGLSDNAVCMYEDQSDNLYVATESSVEYWDGVSFTNTGNPGVASAIVEYQSEIYICGDAGLLSKYSGGTWQPVTTGLINGEDLYDLEVYNNELYVCGDFIGCVAKFDGFDWSLVGGGLAYSTPESAIARTMTLYDGNLYVTGDFNRILGGPPLLIHDVAYWDGSEWTGTFAQYMGISGDITITTSNGNYLYIGGNFTVVGGVDASGFARYNSSTGWEVLDGITGQPYEQIISITAINDDVYIGGFISSFADVSVVNVVRYDGANYYPVGSIGSTNFMDLEFVLYLYPYDGNLHACGSFLNADGTTCNRIGWYGLSTTISEVAIPNISVYPNPTSDVVYVNGEFDNISLINLSGQTMYTSQEFNDHSGYVNQINLEGYKQGTYFMVLEADDQVMTKAIIIE